MLLKFAIEDFIVGYVKFIPITGFMEEGVINNKIMQGNYVCM